MKTILAPLSLALLLGSNVVFADAEIEGIVDRHCQACHDAGLAGAPKLSDAASWAPRLETGIDAMAKTVISGKGAMPPKGTCFSCTEEQIHAAVEELVGRLQ
ncbi:c-type cytochrome [Nitrincola iocasae]|jgi:cytochrome c5|uniref:Cytochrome c5 family protein n=1 Tax=Nitrincola iocasae TaxID=2614693 RepID=A0A5J6LD97_9GAMM|nr:c-type cytochrome [Nitrincola iocasae]QEW06212.1 cytochrome c5 family protein [Nitrincola iocasae]